MIFWPQDPRKIGGQTISRILFMHYCMMTTIYLGDIPARYWEQATQRAYFVLLRVGFAPGTYY